MDSTMSSFSCEYYDENSCDPSKSPCDQVEKCKSQEGMQTACYVVWMNDTLNGVKVKLKGCWLAQNAEYNDCSRNECIAERHTTTKFVKGDNEQTTYYCCCNKPKCNEQFDYLPPKPTANFNTPNGHDIDKPTMGIWDVIVYGFLPICTLAIIFICLYYLYRRYKLKTKTDRFASELGNNLELKVGNGQSPLRSIQFDSKIANGRYGTVWKAKLGEKQTVAVKIFPPQDVDSWSQEQAIYQTPGLKSHSNILHYIGAEVRGGGSKTEYWLITEYKEHGSIHDFLKTHTVTYQEYLRICIGMLRGLSFLHEEYSGNGSGANSGNDTCYKPSIVHRDFKSKNVLLDQNLNACIADFGLAVKCCHGRTPNDVHGQVGTRRYMSPEVLEGATDFSAFAFRQIDVYAAALVLWEVLSRCSLTGEAVGEYKLPFEEEVGSRPSFQELQEYVVSKKQRPKFKEVWKKDSHGAVICTTIEEMWDTEPEARVTAGCAMERFIALESEITKIGPQNVVSQDTDVKMAEKSPLITEAATTTINEQAAE